MQRRCLAPGIAAEQAREILNVNPLNPTARLILGAALRRAGRAQEALEVLEPPARDDRINTSLTYGSIFDMCGIEIDPVSYAVSVDTYVTMHDAGRIMNPMIAEGQIRCAFAQGIAAALYEEFSYNEEGAFLSGTFADYLVPTVSEIPAVEILHYESPSPLTPLGAKGLAEGNCMSTPACIANAIADALGVSAVELPATPRRIHALLQARA